MLNSTSLSYVHASLQTEHRYKRAKNGLPYAKVTVDLRKSSTKIKAHDEMTEIFRCYKLQYNGYAVTSYIPSGLVSRDGIVPYRSVTRIRRVWKIGSTFRVCSVQARGITLNWFQR